MNHRVFIAIVLVLIPVLLFAGEDDRSTLTKPGQDVPDFKVTSIDGKEIDIHKLRGKLVLLNFFATWCSPCMAEMPHLEKDIWQKYKDSDFIVLAIGRKHTQKELIEFNEKHKYTFRIAPDPDRSVYRLFAEKYIPRNYLVDSSGKIIYQSRGFKKDEFDKLIRVIEDNLEYVK